MGYEEVTGNVQSFTGENAVKKVEGKLTGSYIHHGTYGKKATETTVYTFNNNEEVVSVYSKGQLDYKMKNVPVGSWVRITHLGTEFVDSLQKDVHQFKVEIDNSRSEVLETSNETEEEMPF